VWGSVKGRERRERGEGRREETYTAEDVG